MVTEGGLKKGSKKIIFLDMDGTITLPREKIGSEMIGAIMELCRTFDDVGILSGSSFNYIVEQCGTAAIVCGMENSIVLLPCNGTQVYRFQNGWEKLYSVFIKEELGCGNYNELIKSIMEAQSAAIRMVSLNDIDWVNISGHFISYRESMLNWSIIGIDSTKEARAIFANHQDNIIFRKGCVNILKHILPEGLSSRLEFALGGETSIDIFPKSWDKTYGLKHFKNYDAWFIGDRCEPGQNDSHIHELLSKKGRAFRTSGPEETIKIIENIVAKERNV